MYVQLTTGKFWLLKVYTIKFADLIGAINCSINEVIAGYSGEQKSGLFLLKLKHTVFNSLAFAPLRNRRFTTSHFSHTMRGIHQRCRVKLFNHFSNLNSIIKEC
jgi:hypothetical protein